MTMREILRMLFVIAFVILLVQSVKLAYQGWFGRRVSVLANVKESAAEEELAAVSLTDLVDNYEEAREKVKAYEADKSHPIVEENQK